jgi:hypothetical protein
VTLRADNRLSYAEGRRLLGLPEHVEPAPRVLDAFPSKREKGPRSSTGKVLDANAGIPARAELRQALVQSVEAERKRQALATPGPGNGAKKGRHKFAAEPTDGPDGAGGQRRYRSKLEARLARRLEAERQMGGLVSFLPEVSVIVGTMGGKAVRHVIDQLAILEVRPDGTFLGRFVESKGFDAPAGKRKRLAFEKLTGLTVQVVK